MELSEGVAWARNAEVVLGYVRRPSCVPVNKSGEIDGSLDLAGYDLTVTAESRVRANVTAREVDIAGTIQGNVEATRKITVRTGGKLIGDLRTPGIVIEDGSYFKGNIEIVTREARQDEKGAEPPITRTAAAKA